MRHALLCLLLGASCQISFSDDLVYSCANDFECGGGGYTCAGGVCCLATGPELCDDGRDNDCDGLVDECHATTEYTTIVSSTRPEPSAIPSDAGVIAKEDCGDGLDNDGDGAIDCGDEVDCPAGSACIKLSNGRAGVCQAVSKACN